jgi:hypothetical protein
MIVQEASLLEKNFRKITYEVLKILPPKAQFGLTSIIKRMRAGIWGVDIRQLEDVYLELIRSSVSQNNNYSSFSGGQVIITHDVDSFGCYAAIEKICDIEKEYNARSTFLFLTNGDYKIDGRLII